MTEEVKRAVEWLRSGFKSNGFALHIADERKKGEVADLIESLSAELEQVKRERDAAVEDLRGACGFCAHVRDCLVTGCSGDMGEACKQCPCETCFHDSNWQWRGVKEVPHD